MSTYRLASIVRCRRGKYKLPRFRGDNRRLPGAGTITLSATAQRMRE